MNKKPAIKILKRDERRRVSAARKSRSKTSAPVDPTRKVVETVSGWVRDFKEKSNGEASNLLSRLFEKTPRTNEA